MMDRFLPCGGRPCPVEADLCPESQRNDGALLALWRLTCGLALDGLARGMLLAQRTDILTCALTLNLQLESDIYL